MEGDEWRETGVLVEMGGVGTEVTEERGVFVDEWTVSGAGTVVDRCMSRLKG